MTKVHMDRSSRGFVLGNKVLVAEVFAKNGFLLLSSVTGEEQTSEVNVDQIYQDMGGNDTRRMSCSSEREGSHQDQVGSEGLSLLRATMGSPLGIFSRS